LGQDDRFASTLDLGLGVAEAMGRGVAWADWLTSLN
jgi:hypothetical protein